MRLLRLDLTRYGHLSDLRLDFARGAALHVVLGANEAGKSTALAAIGDALFGIPERSRFAFLHEGPKLRLGFEVEGADGTRAAFLRRKGRRDTLMDAAEAPVPETALARLLGGATRELFETTYGLDGEALRRGALSLLESGGEAGESLLAGMGLPHLRRALDRLESEAKALHGDGRGRRRLALATEAWKAERQAAEEASVRPKDWAEAVAARQRIEAELTAAEAESGALTREAARLQRMRRVLPLLVRLDARRAELHEVADAPSLPADAADRLRRAAEALRTAAEDARREDAEATRLREERARLPRDEAVLAVQDAIDALAAAAAVAATAARELPAVRRRAEAHRAEVAEAAAALGLDAAPEALREAVPAPALRARAQALIRRRTELATRLETEDAALRDAGRRRDAAQAALDAVPPPPPAEGLRHALAAARAEGALARDLAEAARALATAEAATARALAALPLWTRDAAALAAAALPLPAAEAAAAARLSAAIEARSAASDAAAALRAELARLEEELAHLARGEEVPTREVVERARGERDAAWRAVRDRLEGGGGAASPDGFEALRDAADRLADARADDAQRVNDYAAKAARLGVLRGREEGLAAVAEETARDVAAAEAAWGATWAPAGLAAGAPAAMAEWRRAREEVLRLATLEEEARARRDAIAGREAAARSALAAVLGAEAEPLDRLLARAETEAAAAARAEEARRRAEEALAREEERFAGARQRRDSAAGSMQPLAAEWDEAAMALGLAVAAPVEAVEAALAAWTRIAEATKAWRAEEGRAADLRAATDGLAAAVRDILSRLGTATEEADAVAAAALLRRLAEAREATRRAEELERAARGRRAAAAAAREGAAAAERELAALCALAGAADTAALDSAIARSERRAALEAAMRELAEELLRGGDGLDEAALRAESEGADPDGAEARLAGIEARQEALRGQLTELGAARQEVASRLAAMEAGRDAALHAQEARHHLAEAQEAAERYARLHLARSLLTAGIERIRQDRQGPLLREAGAHLALLTGGRYARLSADEEETGRVTLRAVPRDGTACPVEALSEGARDQLYLALRVAAVEAHAAGAEPLPFVADDLLASFDDQRAAAGIALLARLGARVQTILFTHHAHLAALAERQAGVQILRLPGPGPAEAARSAA